jgi:hypothetical protein
MDPQLNLPVREKDLVPNDTVLGALPVSGLEGERVVVENPADTFSFYQFIKGAWRAITGTLASISPLTTKGDLLTRDGSTHIRFPVGSNGKVLIANSAQSSGLEWIDIPGSERIEKTVTPIGSFAVGDALCYIPAATGALVLRTADTDSGLTNVNWGTVGSPEWAFRFKAPFNFTLKTIQIYLDRQGTPTDNITCSIYTDSSNNPGTLVSAASNTVAGGTFSTGLNTFNFNQALTGGTNYWIVLNRDGADDNTNYYKTQVNDNTAWQDGNALTMFPDTLSKVSSSSLSGWASNGQIGFYKISGDITVGYQKFRGVRTNVHTNPAAIVRSVNGSDAVAVFAGYASGFSGLTAGEIHSVNGAKVGLALSTTELLVFTRKPIKESFAGLGFTGTTTLYIPLGWKPLTVSHEGLTFPSPTGAELRFSTTNGDDLFAVSNEYESI